MAPGVGRLRRYRSTCPVSYPINNHKRRSLSLPSVPADLCAFEFTCAFIAEKIKGKGEKGTKREGSVIATLHTHIWPYLSYL